MYRQKSYIKRMLQFGASGYLLKDDSAEELLSAIQEVSQGNAYFSKQISPNTFEFQNKRSPKNIDITSREQEVLEHIANGLANKAIAKKLNISSHTVDSHRKNLLRKLQAINAADLIRLASDKGLI